MLWGILDVEQPDTQTMNNIVISSVELIYCYAECLTLHGKDSGMPSVAPAVALLKKLLFSTNEAVQTASRYIYNQYCKLTWPLCNTHTLTFSFSAWLYLLDCFRFPFRNRQC